MQVYIYTLYSKRGGGRGAEKKENTKTKKWDESDIIIKMIMLDFFTFFIIMCV